MFDAQVGLGLEVAGAAFGKEAADVVLGVGVRAGGDADAVGSLEVVTGGEVAAGSLDEPLKDAGAFVADEFERQVVDLAVVGDGPLEGQQADATPEREAAGGDLGAVIATGGGWG